MKKRPMGEIARDMGVTYSAALGIAREIRTGWATNFSDREATGAQLEMELEHLKMKTHEVLEGADCDRTRLEAIKVLAGLTKDHMDALRAVVAKPEAEEKDTTSLFTLLVGKGAGSSAASSTSDSAQAVKDLGDEIARLVTSSRATP